MKVKLFDESHEKDLEKEINFFIASSLNIEIIDIQYQLATNYADGEQIYCFSAMMVYKLDKE